MQAQYVDMVGKGSMAHNDEMFTIRTHEAEVRNVLVNCDDTHMEDVTLKSTAFRNSFISDSPEEEVKVTHQPAVVASRLL